MLLRYKNLTILFVLLSLAYLALSLLTPPDQTALAKYNLTERELFVMKLSIAIPYVLIWFVALIGFLRFYTYSHKIGSSQDGQALSDIAQGLAWLTLWLPFTALLSALSARYALAHPADIAATVQFINYANLAILLTAFYLLHKGATKLLPIVKQQNYIVSQPVLLLFIVFSVLYTFLVLQDPVRQLPSGEVTRAAYYLSDWQIVTTIIIPRLISWFWGIQAVYCLYEYRNQIKGKIYKKGFKWLAAGLTVIISMIITLRCFQSLSSQLSDLGILAILGIVYGLLFMIAAGYGLIARGARHLQRIEDF